MHSSYKRQIDNYNGSNFLNGINPWDKKASMNHTAPTQTVQYTPVQPVMQDVASGEYQCQSTLNNINYTPGFLKTQKGIKVKVYLFFLIKFLFSVESVIDL